MGVMTRLLLLLWVGVTASTVVDLQKRIIGGEDCGPTERLYHVQVRAYTIGIRFGFCGGSLIGDRWILTAAHCWDQTKIMRAVLGIHPGGQATLEEITPHFFFDDQGRPHDIMLLKLTNPTKIKPVQLPDCDRHNPPNPPNPPIPGHTVETAGYGSPMMGANNERLPLEAPVLQCANITVVDCQPLRNCLQVNSQMFYEDMEYQHWKCFQSHGVDVTHGDSGGGVVFNGKIYGVNAFVGNATYACVEAAGFMDVCEYMDWIKTTIGIAKSKLACLNCLKRLLWWRSGVQ